MIIVAGTVYNMTFELIYFLQPLIKSVCTHGRETGNKANPGMQQSKMRFN